MSNELYQNTVFDLEANKVPKAVILPAEHDVVIGSIVKLDGRSSTDPEGVGLTYIWKFEQIPIGSEVEGQGFELVETDSSVVAFAPDVTGIYKVSLVVNDGSLSSDPALSVLNAKLILVPHGQGYVPDASFIWNYLSDFWKIVDGKKRFETFWSGAIQIVSSQVLKLYQYDYNKSIQDIQELFQRRWVAFEPELELDPEKVSFILADDQAGLGASTEVLDPATSDVAAVQPPFTTQVLVKKSEGVFDKTHYGQSIFQHRMLQVAGRSFLKARASAVTVALNSGTDGETPVSSVTFKGTGFTADMVGKTLRILAPDSIAGDYHIDSYVSPTEVTVDVGTPWVSTKTGVEYTVLDTETTHNAFFTDLANVPTGLEDAPWRFSSTLHHSEIDFEKAGVSPGDLLEAEIQRADTKHTTVLKMQVVSVDRHYLGFVLNTEVLEDGVASLGFSVEDQINLSSDLQVPGLFQGVAGELLYTSEAQEVKDEVTSIAFKRQFFEKLLTWESLIDIGPFQIFVRPLRILRNTKIPVDDDLRSVPVLQEYIKQPELVQQGTQVFLHHEGELTAIERLPLVLAENLDYIIDNESKITGFCSLTQGSNQITAPFGDFVDRDIREGDEITVTAGSSDILFNVRRVVDQQTLRVFPISTLTVARAPFKIARRVSGQFIRFVKAFSPKNPAPVRLWGEISYYDNSDAVEDNFGVLVGLHKDDLLKIDSAIPYKSAVHGLMYALATGSTIANLELAGQILLGLPFALYPGRILDIKPGFRKREDGSPLYGRVLVESHDSQGNPLGLTSIYYYPHGRQIDDPNNPGTWIPAVPKYSGLADNPDTGAAYQVGDLLAQFTPLSKGVKILEYLTDVGPDSLTNLRSSQRRPEEVLRKYHTWQLIVNSDLVSGVDVDIVARFLSTAKPHHTFITSSLLFSAEEFVSVKDKVVFDWKLRFFENPGTALSSSVSFPAKDTDGTLIQFGGNFYTRYWSGEDLETTYLSSEVRSTTGGFLTATPTRFHDTPFVRPGDVLYITQGNNKGFYPITTVVDDERLEVSGAAFVTFVPNLLIDPPLEQRFIVFRPMRNPIWEGTVEVEKDDDAVNTQVDVGLFSAGPAVGDTLVFKEDGGPTVSRKYYIKEVKPFTNPPHVHVEPPIKEDTGTYSAWIVREHLLTNRLVHRDGDPNPTFTATFAPGSKVVEFSAPSDWRNLALVIPGDSLEYDGLSYQVIKNNPKTRRLIVSPAYGGGSPSTGLAEISRPGLTASPLSFDFLDRLPRESVELTLVLPSGSVNKLMTTAGSPDVQTTGSTNFNDLGVMTGDFVVLLEGGDSAKDVGYGAGVYPILELVSNTVLRLTDDLTHTIAAGVRYGIRRKRPRA